LSECDTNPGKSYPETPAALSQEATLYCFVRWLRDVLFVKKLQRSVQSNFWRTTGQCLEANQHVRDIQMHLDSKSPKKRKCEYVIEGILGADFLRDWKDIHIFYGNHHHARTS